MVDTSHAMKSIHMHMTASYNACKPMEGLSRRHVLQSSITRLGRSLMALNRTSAWEVLRVLSNGNIMSRGSDISHGSAMS